MDTTYPPRPSARLKRSDYEKDAIFNDLDVRATRARVAAAALIEPLLPPGHPPGLKVAHLLDEMRAQLASLPEPDQELMRLKIAMFAKELTDITDAMMVRRDEITQRLDGLRQSTTQDETTVGGSSPTRVGRKMRLITSKPVGFWGSGFPLNTGTWVDFLRHGSGVR